jgi:hypothetical protein
MKTTKDTEEKSIATTGAKALDLKLLYRTAEAVRFHTQAAGT